MTSRIDFLTSRESYLTSTIAFLTSSMFFTCWMAFFIKMGGLLNDLFSLSPVAATLILVTRVLSTVAAVLLLVTRILSPFAAILLPVGANQCTDAIPAKIYLNKKMQGRSPAFFSINLLSCVSLGSVSEHDFLERSGSEDDSGDDENKPEQMG